MQSPQGTHATPDDARMRRIVAVTLPAAQRTPSDKYRVWFRDRVLDECDTLDEAWKYVHDCHVQTVVTMPTTESDNGSRQT